MTITLAIGLGLSFLVAVALLVQCIACPPQGADELQSRIDSLEMALAESVKALRTIGDSPLPFAAHHVIAQSTLDRIQIPDDQLPTRCYPREADDG